MWITNSEILPKFNASTLQLHDIFVSIFSFFHLPYVLVAPTVLLFVGEINLI